MPFRIFFASSEIDQLKILKTSSLMSYNSLSIKLVSNIECLNKSISITILKLIELENEINKKPRPSKRSDSVIDVDFEEQSNLLAEVNKIRKMINQL